MYYGYDICPKCMDELIEREQCESCEEDFPSHTDQVCKKCGTRLALACVGENKIDDTIYYISFRDENEYRKCQSVVEEIRNIGAIVEKSSTQDALIIRGDFLQTYLTMDILTGACVSYTVTPDFSFSRYLVADICPVCGNYTCEKEIDIDNPPDYVQHGIFCEHCNDWVMFTSTWKLAMDDAIYHLKFSEANMQQQSKELMLKEINNVSNVNKDTTHYEVYGKATEIYELLKVLTTYEVSYDIAPPFPYELPEYVEIDEAYLMSILELVQAD